MTTYLKSHQGKQKELQTNKNILINNKYHTHFLSSHQKTINKSDTQENKPDKQKWAIFNHTGNETRTISKLCKHTNLKISIKTTGTIKHQLKPKITTTI
jgi:mRNA-degrading endonuclease HigB of HigAB toxin-antitoxin module